MAKFLFIDDKLINILLKEERPSGGAAVQVYAWVRGLMETGHEVQVITRVTHESDIKEECRDIRLIPFFDFRKGIRVLRWVYYRFPYFYRKIKEVKPDYLYLSVPGWGSYFIGRICHKLGVKYIQRISNDFFLDERFLRNNSRGHQYFMNKALATADYILCQNDYQLAQVQKKFPGKSVMKISNPIVQKQSGNIVPASERQYIAWIGLFQYQKNLPLLYEIAARLKEVEFRVAGKENSSCDAETRSYLEKLALLPNVHFTGFLHRDEVMPFLSRARFLLNTSHYEGFSNTFIEAMSVGTPILSGEQVNPDGIISKFGLGLVYKDSDDLAKQYGSLTPLQFETMQANTLLYVKENHNHISLANKLAEFLGKG